ncbi:Lrp/AsnC ligand binding domain-containing protein [Mesorhizobium sp. M0207]|uniref:Lrp/AsnC ligand binding domain-containing protein n=1 Tax=unclassified Mesorhizobium TaxID=325217 RepID=UPI00333D9828
MINLERRHLGGVVQAHSVSGPFDVITEIAAPSISVLDRMVDVTGEVAGVGKTQS